MPFTRSQIVNVSFQVAFRFLPMHPQNVKVKEASCRSQGLNNFEVPGVFGFYNTKKLPHCEPENHFQALKGICVLVFRLYI